MNPDTDYFLDIFHRTKKKIYNFVMKMTYDKMLTEDIVQDVYMKFLESIGSLRSLSSAEIWLFSTARNEIYQYYRKKMIHLDKYNPMDIDDIEVVSDESPGDKLEIEDLRDHLNKQLMYMPAEQKEVFLLKEYGGFSYKEISEMLNIDIGLVKSRLHKVRKKMINKLSRIIN